MSRFPAEFIQAIPKTDLHLHLDGSLRIGTLIDLAHEAGVALPAQDEIGLRERVFKDKYQNLEEYLQGFALTTAVMQSENALFRVSYELMMDNAAEGVRYIEVRFAPQLLMSERMSFEQVMGAVDRGLRGACDELNARLRPGEPEYDYGIIACALRSFNEHMAPYYAQILHVMSNSPRKEVFAAGGAYQGGGGGYQGGGGGSYNQPNRNFQNSQNNGPQNQNNFNQGPSPDFDPYMGDPGFQPPPDDDIPF